MLKLEWHLLPQYTIIPARRSTAEAVQILLSHLLGDAISPAIVGGISDAVYSHIKWWYHSEDAGRSISTEYALFTTAIVCVLGGGAFLISSLTVEADRAVSKRNLGHGVCTL